MHWIDDKARTNLRPYLFQSGLAMFTVLLILLFLDTASHAAIIAVLGSSAFLVFTRPRAYASQPRRLLGGYVIGGAVGIACHYISLFPLWSAMSISPTAHLIVFGALAVGAGIFLMVVTNTDHPPAAGMSLGLVLNSWDKWDLMFIMAAVLFMAVMRKVLQSVMIDLV